MCLVGTRLIVINRVSVLFYVAHRRDDISVSPLKIAHCERSKQRFVAILILYDYTKVMSTISWVTGSTIVYLSIIFPTLIIAPLSSCDTAREGATRDFNVQIYANKCETGINILSSEMAWNPSRTL